MATTMLPIRPVGLGIRASAVSSDRKQYVSVSNGKSSSPNWWSPLFGWSAEPDYIVTDTGKPPADMDRGAVNNSTARSRVSRGSFTEEKARQLRKLTTESSTFHDVMYHSAIASRLASDFSDR